RVPRIRRPFHCLLGRLLAIRFDRAAPHSMVRGKRILARCGTASRHRAVQNRLALAAEALHAQGPDAAAPALRQNLLLEAAIGSVKAVERQRTVPNGFSCAEQNLLKSVLSLSDAGYREVPAVD